MNEFNWNVQELEWLAENGQCIEGGYIYKSPGGYTTFYGPHMIDEHKYEAGIIYTYERWLKAKNAVRFK